MIDSPKIPAFHSWLFSPWLELTDSSDMIFLFSCYPITIPFTTKEEEEG
jgi:hypothetical protein